MYNIYIAADGGGTKLELIALSSRGERLARVRVPGGVNRKTNSAQNIENTVREALDRIKETTGGARIALIAGYLMHNNEVFEKLGGCEVTEVDEGTLGLYAAGIYGTGALILSGTGADVYVVKEDGYDIIGGYGAILGDPGSGFAIGAAAINAAAAYYEGRGEETSLLGLLRKKYPADTFRGSLYGIYGTPETARNVADFCRECEQAADGGDAVAHGIFGKAADDLITLARAAYKKHGLPKDTPYTFAGGVLLHDLKREKSLMADRIIQGLSREGITNHVPPECSPAEGAARWIIRNKLTALRQD